MSLSDNRRTYLDTTRVGPIETEGVTRLRQLVATKRDEARRHKNRAELWKIRYDRLWKDLQRVERECDLLRHKLAEVREVVSDAA